MRKILQVGWIFIIVAAFSIMGMVVHKQSLAIQELKVANKQTDATLALTAVALSGEAKNQHETLLEQNALLTSQRELITKLSEEFMAQKTLDQRMSETLEKTRDSVVVILVQNRLKPNGGGIGTGWFVEVNDEYAYVVTNHHVVAGYIKSPKLSSIVMQDALTPWEYDMELVGYDEIADIAVLKVKKSWQEPWVALEWADHRKTEAGQPVLIVGHGMSMPWSMSTGIVTAMDRHSITPYQLMIQTDAVINKGNSGGPMMDINGKVIGVVDALLDPNTAGGGTGQPAYAGVGLAITGYQAQKSVEEIINCPVGIMKGGCVTYPQFGFVVRAAERDEVVAQQNAGMIPSYAAIGELGDDERAKEAGLLPDDIVVGFDGQSVTSIVEIYREVLRKRAGDVVVIDIYRNGKTVSVEYKLGEWKRS